jgi:hypothetical protein
MMAAWLQITAAQHERRDAKKQGRKPQEFSKFARQLNQSEQK